ncbi:MAG: metalloregulator ArsR/SmtB family transcription factor, partial [Methylococcales bacterium]|nr:metalloregulator ArsR/SmtB family transcription factor [Methylococcales bacterium]
PNKRSIVETLLKALKAAAEVTRLRILASLAQSDLTVTELVSILGQSQPRVSRHLKLMVEAGLLTRYQEGSWVFHRLADQETSSIALTLSALINYQDPLLQQDSERLKDIKQQNADLAAAYFKTHAEDWDKVREYSGSAVEIEAALLAAVGNRQPELMIDLGTGTGRMLQIFAPLIQRGFGYDSSHEMLNVARANLDHPQYSHSRVRQSDIRTLPVEKTTTDLITIHQVLHYLDDPISVIREAARILSPGGQFLIVDFAQHQQEALRTEHAHRRLGFSDDEIKLWCQQSNLTVQDAQVIPNQHGDDLTVKLWIISKNSS